MSANIGLPGINLPAWMPGFVRNTERAIDGSRSLEVYTVATLPPATAPYRWIFVSDETGGPAPAINNGNDWLRFPDGAVVS